MVDLEHISILLTGSFKPKESIGLEIAVTDTTKTLGMSYARKREIANTLDVCG